MTLGGPGSVGEVDLELHILTQEALATLAAFKKTADDSFKNFTKGLPDSQKDLAKVNEALKGLSRVITDFERQTGGRQLIPEQSAAINQLKELKGAIQDALGEQKIVLPTANLATFDKQAQSLAKLQVQAESFNKAIGQGLPASFVTKFKDGNTALQAYGNLQAKAIAENEKFNASHQQLGQAVEKSTNPLKRFADSLVAGDAKLKTMGLSVRGISVLLGAGLATGIVGIIRIVERLTKRVADFVGGEIELQRQTNLTFRDGSDAVTKFADTTAHALNISRDEALKTANQFAAFGRTIGIPAETSVNFSEALTSIAGALAQTQPGFKGAEDAAKVLEQALRGDIGALEALGLKLPEIVALSEKFFGKLPDQLTSAEKGFLGLNATAQSAADSIKEFGIKGSSGLQVVKDYFKNLSRAKTELEDFRTAQQSVNDTLAGKQTGFISGIDNLNGLSEKHLLLLRQQAGGNKELTDAIDKEIEARKNLGDAIIAQAAAVETLADVQKANLEIFKASHAEQLQAVGLATTLARAQEDGALRIKEANLQGQRAIEDNAKRARDVAQRNLRAGQDALTAFNNAEQHLSDARKDRAIRDQESAMAFAQTQTEVFRSNRSAAEKLSDFERDQARKLFDLQEAVRRARHADQQDAFAVQTQIINARIRGQNDLVQQGSAQLAAFLGQGASTGANQLADAEKNLARFQEDHAIDLKRLQRDVVETRIDGVAKMKKAVLDQQKSEMEGSRAVRDATEQVTKAKLDQQRAIEDATNATNDLTTANNRALEDARRARDTAVRERDRAIKDAERALNEFVANLNKSIQDLDNIIKPLLDPTVQKALQNWIDRMNAAVDFATLNFGFGAIGKMAGGDIPGMTPIIWNEPTAGGELLITPAGGTVISHADFIRLIRQLEKQGAGGNVINVPVQQTPSDPVAQAWRIGREIIKQL